jgi:hypothetical protein
MWYKDPPLVKLLGKHEDTENMLSMSALKGARDHMHRTSVMPPERDANRAAGIVLKTCFYIDWQQVLVASTITPSKVMQ